MKFYKRDPDRALAGMAALNSAQRGIYNSIIDLLYSRDGIVACQTDADDHQIAKYISIDIREWRHIKRQLMELGKIRVTNDGLLDANGVAIELRSATDRSEIARRSATHRWDLWRLAKQFNDPAMRERNAIKSKSKKSSTNVEVQQDNTCGKVLAENSKDKEQNNSEAVEVKPNSIASGELEAIIRRKQQFDKAWR